SCLFVTALFSSRPPRPPTSPLFPYTTLFRSRTAAAAPAASVSAPGSPAAAGEKPGRARAAFRAAASRPAADEGRGAARTRPSTRSEEHTSELQSLTNLVCRLLLETKKHSTHT